MVTKKYQLRILRSNSTFHCLHLNGVRHCCTGGARSPPEQAFGPKELVQRDSSRDAHVSVEFSMYHRTSETMKSKMIIGCIYTVVHGAITREMLRRKTYVCDNHRNRNRRFRKTDQHNLNPICGGTRLRKHARTRMMPNKLNKSPIAKSRNVSLPFVCETRRKRRNFEGTQEKRRINEFLANRRENS